MPVLLLTVMSEHSVGACPLHRIEMRSATADNQCCRRRCCRRHDGKLFGLGPLVPFCPAKLLSHSLSLLIHFLARVGDGFGRG